MSRADPSMMILKHSAQYLVAVGLPGLVNFLAIAVYTQLLAPEEYGRYALVMIGVGFFNSVFFQWVRLSLFRFFPTYFNDLKPLLSTVLACFFNMALLSGIIGIVTAWLWPDSTWRGLILLAIPLLWLNAWFELILVFAQNRLKSGRYGIMSGIKAVSALLLGALAVLWGLGTYGPLLGLIIGFLLASLFWGRSDLKGVLPKAIPALRNKLLRYGLPLTGAFVLEFVVSGSDRLLIARFLGEGPAGVYSASYDLTRQSIMLLMMVVNLATSPLAVQAFEAKGEVATKQQLTKNGLLLFGVAFPASAGLVVLAPQVTKVFLGVDFQKEADYLIPLLTVSALISGVRLFHFDLAFKIGQQTINQVYLMAGVALLSVLLNLLWIPQLGLIGAAWVSVVSNAVALLLSVYLGRRIFTVPVEWKATGKLVLATGVLVLFLLAVRELGEGLSLIIGVIGGTLVYGVVVFLLNVGGGRQ